IGFMGSGKTTVGKKLASRLGFSFVDMDREIEKNENKSIAVRFKEYGENYFREKETSWLESLNEDNLIISTGGGSPCFGNNMALMKQKGKVVFLSTSPGILASRLFNGGAGRPLLEKYVQNREQLENYISQKLKERLPVYEKADIIVDSADLDSKRLNELAESLIK
ncbi:MAG: shikimate kinase, partial [Crocinitomicaceae bacterium]|nr:shikimate kinase [Crocinitomicaceae bacterium]